jgi:hypothetical protein
MSARNAGVVGEGSEFSIWRRQEKEEEEEVGEAC